VKLVPPVCEPGGVPVRLFHGPLRETPAMTQDDKTPERPKPELPGNHGQFGEDNATEDYKLLEDQPSPGEPASDDAGSQGPKQTNAGERS
jgi:hypothetical protein